MCVSIGSFFGYWKFDSLAAENSARAARIAQIVKGKPSLSDAEKAYFISLVEREQRTLKAIGDILFGYGVTALGIAIVFLASARKLIRENKSGV